jgi:hypothetical protein
VTVERYEPDGLARWIHTAQPAAALAERIAETEFVPGPMRGKPAVVAACIMYGDEIGVGPMQALASIHVVDGRPFPSAELLRALILRDGHTFRVLESTGTKCRVMGLRRGRPDSEAHYVVWDIEMARAAGLAGKGAWRSYPRALLLARASTDLARMAFPDVVKGLGHVPDVPDVATEWAEMASASGLPDNPEPAEARSVQWTGAQRSPDSPSAAVAPRPNTPPPGPDYVPWDNDPEPTPEAVETPSLPPREAPPEKPERPASRETVTRVMAAYGDLGYGNDRTTRLALFSSLLGFPVESTKSLPGGAALRLYGQLVRLREGSLLAIADGHGGFDIQPGDDGPDEDADP